MYCCAILDGFSKMVVALTVRRNPVTAGTDYLTGLHSAGRTLAGCQQADLDAFFAAAPSTGRHIRPFLTWAQQRRHLPSMLQLPPSRRGITGRAR